MIVVAGMQDGEPYLGFVNLQGTAFTDDIMATGMGVDLCLPVMRKAVETKVQCNVCCIIDRLQLLSPGRKADIRGS